MIELMAMMIPQDSRNFHPMIRNCICFNPARYYRPTSSTTSSTSQWQDGGLYADASCKLSAGERIRHRAVQHDRLLENVPGLCVVATVHGHGHGER
mmetsp:Transcript_5463/g.11872  ORF Transcript_5463/g.11872 Transcript_5463/m.11872 type:complete len:96 (+) Transcript_5463:1400-1687(+)